MPTVDSMVGESAILLEDLAPGGIGKAELHGTTWTVHNAGQAPVKKNQRCKVERVDGLDLGDQVHLEREQARGRLEREPREKVPVGVLLPMNEVLAGLHLERVARDPGLGLGRGSKSNDLRTQGDQAVI